MENNQRIKFLDGFRGIAILLVMFYHSYSLYPDILPEITHKYGEFPLFKYGFFGVQLFFLISGFVILMSIESKKTFPQFLYKRWLRLFPAMLIAVIFMGATSAFLQERPLGQPTIGSYIMGLFFIDPDWIEFFSGIKINPLETVFWSLYAEIRFYLVFGVVYFLFGKIKAIITLFGLFLLTVLVMFTGMINKNLPEYYMKIGEFMGWHLSLGNFQWFACGALVYQYFTERKKKYIVLYCATILFAIILAGSVGNIIMTLIIGIIFLAPFCTEKIHFLFDNRFFDFMGFISYPLYLMHKSAIIALTVKIQSLNIMPIILLPLIPMIIMVIISYVVAKYIEPKLGKTIDKGIMYIMRKRK
jgi:peptidoglycan/LPS O-acetylase OafA/YrhL